VEFHRRWTQQVIREDYSPACLSSKLCNLFQATHTGQPLNSGVERFFVMMEKLYGSSS
jgi:hypothetical protein